VQAQAALVFAEQSLDVKLTLSSAPQRNIPPKSLLTSVFTIQNSGTIEDTYILEPHVPDGWSVISSLNPLTLSANETKVVPLTVSIPSDALARFPYQLGLSVSSSINREISDTVSVKVSILPRARVKLIGPSIGKEASQGHAASYTFTIMNLGNAKDIFEISALSAHREKLGLSKYDIELGPGAKEEIIVTTHVPLDVSPGTMHVITVRATSILLEKGVFDEAIVHTPIQKARSVKEAGLYKTLPSQLVFYLSGFGTGEKIGPQVEFDTGGYLDDTHWLNFKYEGPYFKDRQNYRGLSEEHVSFEAGGEAWDMRLGDITVGLSELTVSSLSRQGGAFGLETDKWSSVFFNLEEDGKSFKQDLSGARVTTKIGDNNEFGINFFHQDEEKVDSSATREREKKRILSLSTQHTLDNLVIQSEYGASRFDNRTDEKEDSAWWVESRLKEEQVHANAEYIHAGSNYPGSRKDIDGYKAYLSYRIFKPIWAWIYKNISSNNLDNDPAKSTDETDRLELGASFTKEKLPSLSLSYGINKGKSEQANLVTSDSKEDVILFRTSQTMGRLSISFDSQWSKTHNDITRVDSKSSQYTTRIYRRWEKFSTWLDYSYNVEDDTTVLREGIGMVYQPTHKLYCSFSFSQEGTKGKKDSEILSLDMSYDPEEDTSFSLEGEMRNNHEDVKDEWEFWLSFTKRFDLAIPFVKIRGSVDGRVFIDDNNNGELDNGEKGISGIRLLIDKNKAITNKKGRFRFASVIPGEYGLDIDVSSLSVGLAPRMTLPYEIDVPKGRLEAIDIPLVRVCRVNGVVFEDKNKDGSRDDGERGTPLVRVLLVKGDAIMRDTFSDGKGAYSFSGILPGRYEVSIDKDWLPSRHRLTTKAAYSIDLGPGEELKPLDFGSIEKERRIIKTYPAL